MNNVRVPEEVVAGWFQINFRRVANRLAAEKSRKRNRFEATLDQPHRCFQINAPFPPFRFISTPWNRPASTFVHTLSLSLSRSLARSASWSVAEPDRSASSAVFKIFNELDNEASSVGGGETKDFEARTNVGAVQTRLIKQ